MNESFDNLEKEEFPTIEESLVELNRLVGGILTIIEKYIKDNPIE